MTRPATAWLYLASTASSMLGNAVASVVWPWLVLERTGDPAAAGLVAAAIAVPSLLFAFLGGQLIDTLGRKPMSVISDVISAASIVGVIIVDARLGLTLAWFIVLGIIGAVGDIPGMSARQALVGDVARTSGRSLDFLSGINQSIAGVSWLVGPALAGLLMSTLPVQQVLWITAGCSFLAAALTALLRLLPATAPVDVDAPDFRALRSWTEVVRPPSIRLLALTTLVSGALVTPYLMVLLPAHFQAIDSPGLLGLSLSGYAVGMIAAGLLVAAVGTTRRRLQWAGALGLYLVGYSLLGFLGSTPAVIVGMVISGLGGGFMGPLQMVLVTEEIPERLRGRAFSVFMAINQFASPVGLVVATAVLTRVSIYVTAGLLASVWVAFAVWAIVRGWRIFPAAVDRPSPEVQSEK